MRMHRVDDLDECAAMWADPVVTRYIGGRPFSREESWARLLRYAGHWPLMGFGYWAIEEKVTGRFAGEVGFADFKRMIEPPLDDVPELGWVLVPHLHGKGYGSEAVRAAAAWGDSHLASAWTSCLIHPENLASLRIAEKCGFREQRRVDYRGQCAVVFVRSAPAR